MKRHAFGKTLESLPVEKFAPFTIFRDSNIEDVVVIDGKVGDDLFGDSSLDVLRRLFS